MARRKPATQPIRRVIRGIGFEANNQRASNFQEGARSGRQANGAFMRRADRQVSAASARQIRKDISTPGNEYRYGTKEEVQAQHNATYRRLRKAFGMSAG